MAAANQTSAEEDHRLRDHLLTCAVCSQAFEQYTEIAAQMYAEGGDSEFAFQSLQIAEYEAVEQVTAKERLLGQMGGTIRLVVNEKRPATIAGTRTPSAFSLHRMPAWATGALAAGLLLAVCLASAGYWSSRKYSKDAEAKSARLKREVDELRGELARLQAVPAKPASEALAKTRDEDLQKLRADNEVMHLTLLNLEATRQRETDENAELQARIRLLQSSLDVLKASNASLEAEKSGLAEKVANTTADLRKSQDEMERMAAWNEELSQESLAQGRSAERQQKLLATDHDIRDILGARSLHIIDVFDVSSLGEFERPFGRIFYTEGKSLIFYAFDLDQQKGLKRGAVFQAWGQRGVGKEDSRSLGMFYMDDPSQNRWVLKVDDSKALSRIDYVFVTDGYHKEGVRPRGKPLLSAFLSGGVDRP